MAKQLKIPPMRETALGLFMSERPTPAGAFRKEVNTVLTQHQQPEAPEIPAEKFQCPDCDRTFAKAQGLGAHRSRVHGYRNPRSSSRAREIKTDMDLLDNLLVGLFPDGIPADRETLGIVNDFIQAYERLAKLVN